MYQYVLILVGYMLKQTPHGVWTAGTNQVLLAPQRLYVSIMRSVLPEDKSLGGDCQTADDDFPGDQVPIIGDVGKMSWYEVFKIIKA